MFAELLLNVFGGEKKKKSSPKQTKYNQIRFVVRESVASGCETYNESIKSDRLLRKTPEARLTSEDRRNIVNNIMSRVYFGITSIELGQLCGTEFKKYVEDPLRLQYIKYCAKRRVNV